MSRKVRALTFDVGNTLLPFRAQEMDKLLRGFLGFVRDRVGPFDEDAVIARYHEVRLAQYRVNRALLRENDLVERVRLTVEAAMGRQVTAELLADAMEAYVGALVAALPVPDGLPRLLDRLGSGYRLGVITNYPYAPGSRRVLEAKGLSGFFSSVVISADWGFIKPHPLLFRRAAAELGVAPEEMVHVGDDWEADVIGATRAGAGSVLFTGYREEPDPFRGDPAGRPLAIVERLEDLEEVLEVAALARAPV